MPRHHRPSRFCHRGQVFPSFVRPRDRLRVRGQITREIINEFTVVVAYLAIPINSPARRAACYLRLVPQFSPPNEELTVTLTR